MSSATAFTIQLHPKSSFPEGRLPFSLLYSSATHIGSFPRIAKQSDLKVREVVYTNVRNTGTFTRWRIPSSNFLSASILRPQLQHDAERTLNFAPRALRESLSDSESPKAVTLEKPELNNSQNFDLNEDLNVASESDEDVGEVHAILGDRVTNRLMEYLIRWTDDHPDSWEPAKNIALDLLDNYDQPWLTAARKGDDAKLKELLEASRENDAPGRNVDAIDSNERTALHFAAGLGSEKCLRWLIENGADVDWQDKDGYTPLHIATGYVHVAIVKALVESGANADVEDKQQRTPLALAQMLLEKIPAGNVVQFGRRVALDQIVKVLDEATFEEVEVEQILDKRTVREKDGEGQEGLEVVEYLVRWSDGSEDSWEPSENISSELIEDFDKGLEYAEVETILERRTVAEGAGEVEGEREGERVEYLVKWVDDEECTWEPEANVAAQIAAEFEGKNMAEMKAERRARGVIVGEDD